MVVKERSKAWRDGREAQFVNEYPNSLGELLAKSAAEYGDSVAMDFFEAGQQLSFRDWDLKASQLAEGLRRLGVRREMRVGVMLSNRIEIPIIWMALARMGAVMVPVNPSYTSAELRHVVNTAGVKFLVLEKELVPQAATLQELPAENLIVVGVPPFETGHRDWQSLFDDSVTVFKPEFAVQRKDLATIQFTSGTTGFPKGCMQSHTYWLANAFNNSTPTELCNSAKILSESPLFYFDGLLMILRPLNNGPTVFQAERMSVSKQYERLTMTKVEIAYAPFLAEEPDPREREHDVKIFITAGSPAAYSKAVESRCGGVAREAYGMTEIGVVLGVPAMNEDESAYGTCGVPYPMFELKIVDDQGVEQPDDTPGELWVKGMSIMDGYWDNPEANEKSFEGDWFRTGDIFEKTSSGFYRYAGRIKDMIKRSGENISAVEVESVISQFLGIEAVAVIPVPSSFRGEEVKAVIQLKDGVSKDELDLMKLKDFCGQHLAKFKIPRFISYVDAFEYTPSLKIIKAGLVKDHVKDDCWDYQSE